MSLRRPLQLPATARGEREREVHSTASNATSNLATRPAAGRAQCALGEGVWAGRRRCCAKQAGCGCGQGGCGK